MSDVQRYARRLGPGQVREVLAGGAWAVEALPTSIALAPVEAAIASVGSVEGSAIDKALIEPLHGALGLTRREAADPRVWQWLCVARFPDLVWRRWGDGTPAAGSLDEALTRGMKARFLCSPSLNGISRNTLARLWWTAEQLDGDYDLARKALERQDLFQAVFERFIGMYPPAARACLAKFDGKSEAQVRDAAKWLQQCASTTVIEELDQQQIEAILDEALAAGA